MESGNIGNIGERHATAWLANNGFRCHRNTQLPGSTDIEAVGNSKSLLVQVKTGMSPNDAPYISAEERRNIIARANRLGREAWCARVQINFRGELVGQIQWEKLN